MRADARANRQALLDAGRRLYAARGAVFPFSAVAAEAGVGIATLYRHFPTPADLAVGLVEDIRDRAVAVSEHYRPEMQADPEQTWPRYAAALLDLNLASFLPQLAEASLVAPERLAAARATVLRHAESIFAVAKRAGLVRESVTMPYFLVGLGLIGRPAPAVAEVDRFLSEHRVDHDELPELREWLLAVYLRGLRPAREYA